MKKMELDTIWNGMFGFVARCVSESVTLEQIEKIPAWLVYIAK